MAYINNGVTNSLASNMMPSGYTRSAGTPLEVVEYTRIMVLSILKSDVDEIIPKNTMIAIDTEVSTLMDAVVLADIKDTTDVTFHTSITNMASNAGEPDGNGGWLSSKVTRYNVTIALTIYIETP